MEGRVVEIAPGTYRGEMRQSGIGIIFGWAVVTDGFGTIEEAESALRECMDRRQFKPRVVRRLCGGGKDGAA